MYAASATEIIGASRAALDNALYSNLTTVTTQECICTYDIYHELPYSIYTGFSRLALGMNVFRIAAALKVATASATKGHNQGRKDWWQG